MRSHGVIAAIVLLTASALLAERPGSPEVRDREATHVLVGVVKAVYARKLVTGLQGPGTIETHTLVEIEVDDVERGEGIEKQDLAYVRCWQITRNGPSRTAGPSGHQPIPKAGDRVRAYVARGPYGPTRQTDQGLAAVYPNGFEILPPRSPSPPVSRATRSVASYEWPPWSDDLQPEKPSAYPGLDIHAENPYAPPGDEDLRYIRVRITPGRDPDGATRRVLAVHFRGPPGRSLAAHSAHVLPSTIQWTSALIEESNGCAFAAVSPEHPMPEQGLVFVFVVKADTLEEAYWRDVQTLLSKEASTTLPDGTAGADALVGSLYSARRAGSDGPIEFPLRLPYGEN